MTTTTNGPTIREVEAAVRSVLSATAPAFLRSSNGRPARPTEADVFPGRLLSLREAESLPPGVRSVAVVPGTVVTPLAREHLKHAGIAIRLVSRAEFDPAGRVGEWAFAIESNYLAVEPLRRTLLDATDAWRELGAATSEAAHWVAADGARGALVVTDQAAKAVYLAYQVPGVRAAAAGDPVEASRAVRAIGANLLAVEPAGRSIALLKQIAATFRRAGGPAPPPDLDAVNGEARP